MTHATGQGTAKVADPAIPKMEMPVRSAPQQRAATPKGAPQTQAPATQAPPALPGSTAQPPPGFPNFSRSRGDMPQNTAMVAIAFFVMAGAVLIIGPFARAMARHIDRKTENLKAGQSNLEPQVRQLQDSMDAMAIELERISEGQRFTTKVLTERKPG